MRVSKLMTGLCVKEASVKQGDGIERDFVVWGDAKLVGHWRNPLYCLGWAPGSKVELQLRKETALQ